MLPSPFAYIEETNITAWIHWVYFFPLKSSTLMIDDEVFLFKSQFMSHIKTSICILYSLVCEGLNFYVHMHNKTYY